MNDTAEETNTINESPEEAFGYRLAEARRAKGWRQIDLANETDMRANQVSRYETGGIVPNLVQLRRLSDALQVSPSWLVYGSDKPFAGEGFVERLATMSPERAMAVLAVALPVLDRDDRRSISTLVLHLFELQRGTEATDMLFTVAERVADSFEGSGVMQEQFEAVGEKLAEEFGTAEDDDTPAS